jgi:general stress protein YciG
MGIEARRHVIDGATNPFVRHGGMRLASFYPLGLPNIGKEIRNMAQTRGAEGRTSNRGFASMNQERQRQIASMGGKAVPDSKRSFSQNRDLAAQAGRKGGQSVPDEKRSFSQNPGLAAQAGRKGGQASHGAFVAHDAPAAAESVAKSAHPVTPR